MDEPLKKIGSVCIIIGYEFTRLSDALKAYNDAMVTLAACIDPETEIWGDVSNPVADLRRLLEDMDKEKAMAELADLAEESVDIPPPRKMPRPPKRTGPVNKFNYTANRPPRVARSSCRTVKR